MFDFISIPLGYVLQFFYQLVNDYALSIFLFTLFTRVLLLPFAIKQQKSQIAMAKIQPKMDEIKEKYKDDRQRQAQEMQRVQKEEGYSAMAGCLPTLIQLPIMFGLIGVIYNPLTHILRIPAEIINKAKELLATKTSMPELDLIGAFQGDPGKFAMLADSGIKTLDLKLFGFIDLTKTPSISEFGWLWLIPIFAGLTQVLLSWIMGRFSKKNGMKNTGMGMMMTMSLVSVYFGFTLPAGAGFYWICSSVIAIVQAVALGIIYSPVRIGASSEFTAAKKRLLEEQNAKRIMGKLEAE